MSVLQDNFSRFSNVGNSVVRNIIPLQISNTTFHNKDSYKILTPITHAPVRSKNFLPINNVNHQTSSTSIFRNDPIGNIAISPTFTTNSSRGTDTDPSSLPNPITQGHIKQSYYYSSTSISYIPVFNAPSSVNDNSTASRTSIPPKIDSPNTSLSPLHTLPSINDISMTAISERKCEEYEKEIVRTIASVTGSSSNVNNSCFSTNHLVVGDNQAQVNEFPHMVALGTLNSNGSILMCGGTLISHTWVLSAAHCSHGPNGSPTHARIGTHRLSDQAGVMVLIKNIVRHPDYVAPAHYANIALVQLMNAVTFSISIRPACLYQQYDTVPTQTWFSGWNITQYKGEDFSRVQKAQLETIDNLFCTVRHNISTKIPYGVTPSMLCAGDPRGNWTKDGCQKDFGGPLQIIHPDRECLFQVVGIFSFSKGCGLVSNPGVYTRVSHYLPWIEEIVWPQEQ